MGIDSVQVRFTNCVENVCFSGQEVTGEVVFKVTGKDGVKVKTVEVKLQGKTEWSYKNGDTTLTSTEVYLDSSAIAFPVQDSVAIDPNSPVAASGNVIPPGTHKFTFGFQLPLRIPSSFMYRKIRLVRYYVEVIVVRPWTLDRHYEFEFSVVTSIDLDQLQEQNRPIEDKVSKKDINAAVSLKKSGFVPGENIKISANVENKGKGCVQEFRALLKQKVTIIDPRGKTLSKDKTIAKIYTPENVNSGQSSSWLDKKLRVPSVPPWDSTLCKNLSITYWLEFIAVPKGLCNRNIVLKIPITIGAIPNRGQQQQSLDHKGADPMLTLPKPTFSVSFDDSKTHQSNKVEDIFCLDKSKFKPKYPVWNIE